MGTKAIAAAGIILLSIGFVGSLAMFFMEIGLLWELKLLEVPLVLGMVTFISASFLYEDATRELFPHLEIQRFAAFAAAIIGAIGIVAKII